jgi:hypothetical protein
MSIAQRVAARALYGRWFYAPHATGRRCAERLRVLGFVWDGSRWHRPTKERFLEGLKQ